MKRKKKYTVTPFRAAGCDCLTCRDFEKNGVPPTTPKDEADAFLLSLRPLTSASRRMVSATIKDGKVLAVRYRNLRTQPKDGEL